MQHMDGFFEGMAEKIKSHGTDYRRWRTRFPRRTAQRVCQAWHIAGGV